MKKSFAHSSILLLFVCIFVSEVNAQDTLNIAAYEMDHCVPLNRWGSTAVISSREELDSMIRNDASRDRCMELLRDFDTEQFSLLGIDVNSGYCRIPFGLKYKVVEFSEEKKYVLSISYVEPTNPCRAMSSYHLWLQVPKLPKGYEVEFVVSSEEM